MGVSHVAGPDILLHSMGTTHEVIPEGGWHCVHKLADWDGQYLDQKKERKLLSGKSKLREV